MATPDKHITDVSFDMIGEYVFSFTADDGELSTTEQITVTVTSNPALPQTIADFDFEEITGTNKFYVNSDLGIYDGQLDINSELTPAKDGNGLKYTGKIAGGYLELPAAFTKNLTTATISLDIMLDDNQANRTTVIEFGSKLVVEFIDGDELSITVNGNLAATGVRFAPGYWKNITLTADGDDYARFIDGLKKAELIDTGLIMSDIDSTSERYLVGRSAPEADPFLKATIDNFMAKSYVMTDADLLAAYGSSEDRTVVEGGSSVIVTTVGTVPVLPTQVDVLYSDGVYELGNVVWNEPEDSVYDNAGTVDIDGVVEGTDIAVEIRVMVVSGSLQNIAAKPRHRQLSTQLMTLVV
jgi:hypothetical protein